MSNSLSFVKIRSNKFGFTLVELLLVVGLMAIVAGLGSDILISVIRAYNKAQTLGEIEQNGSFASTVLENKLRGCLNIQIPDGLGGYKDLTPADGTFTGNEIQIEELTGSPYVVRYIPAVYDVSDCTNNGFIELNGQTLTNTDLNSGVNITVSGGGLFQVYKPNVPGSPIVAKVKYNVSQSCTSTFNVGASFDTTVTVRGNYGK